MTTGKVFDRKPYAGKWPILSTFACGVGLLCSCAVAEENAEGPIESPHARGGVVSIVETETCRRYVHVFTNTAEVAQFRNRSRQALRGRILVVGAGGAGGYGLNASSGGGGGGGGGGVWEQKGFAIPSGACWNILVGKGSIRTTNVNYSRNDTAGASSISNGTACIARVPGGGNGGESTGSNAVEDGHAATSGAAGGGGIRPTSARDGAEGTYASSIDGVSYGPFSGGTGSLYRGGGGGGAGAAGSSQNGGEGLVSDITGVSLVYGSGGGGGGSLNPSSLYSNGTGGTRAGDGAFATVENASTNVTAATVPVANSGGGGAGGLGGTYTALKGSARWGSSGADGIVIIAYEFYKIPFVGGEVTKIAEQGDTSTYIHVFTNVSEVAGFENITGEDIPVRALVVGAGGAGGYGLNASSGGGGGGGGGGVLDVANVMMPADSVWNVLVGKGARASTSTSSPKNDTAGASSISNGTACIALVPGGGNGGESTSSSTNAAGDVVNGHAATSGAAGGGGIRASREGAEGTYASSVLGVTYGPFPGGTDPSSTRSGGGGGAGAAGSNETGGEGLASDITGVSLVYGSGGGGGGSLNPSSLYSNGTGGTRAGDGAFATVVNASTNVTAATVPVANSGGGGAGGLGGTFTALKGSARWGSPGADGIVVIRYDWTFNPNPPVFGFKLIIQ